MAFMGHDGTLYSNADIPSLRDVRRLIDVPMADRWAGESCTLDGKPARVLGRLQRFAIVSTDRSPRTTVEFAWITVDRIMSSTQAFRS